MRAVICIAVLCLFMVTVQGYYKKGGGGRPFPPPWIDVNIFNPDIQWVTRFANMVLAPANRIIIKKRAQVQFWAGVNYRIYAIVNNFGIIKRCTITVRRPWKGKKRLIGFTCKK